MTPLRALVLGAVQGLTEFLPISSSGHLVLVPHVFGWEEQPLAFDVALHVGTLLAVLLYFRRDWSALLVALWQDLRRWGLRVTAWSPRGRLAFLLGLGTLPAVVVGLFLSSLEDRLRTPEVVAATLALVGVAMAVVERWAAHGKVHDTERLGVRQAVLIGMAQACALVPGVSRSGATITTGMATGLGRATAARFSFLLAIPIMFAAAAKELPGLADASAQGVDAIDLAVGITTSFAVGMAAIAFLLRYLATRGLYVFAVYRVLLAGVILLWVA